MSLALIQNECKCFFQRKNPHLFSLDNTSSAQKSTENKNALDFFFGLFFFIKEKFGTRYFLVNVRKEKLF